MQQPQNQLALIPAPLAFQGKARRARPNRNKPARERVRRSRVGPNPVNPRDSRVIKASVASTKIVRTGNPKMTRRPNGDIIVSHREFIADLPGSEDFQVTKIAVNPGLSQSFPWLSMMAGLYESYSFEKLDFEFETTSSTSTTGSVMLAVDYDASDANPVQKSQLAAFQDYCRSSPWESFVQRSSKQNLSKRKSYYVRDGALSANQDVKLYDVGNLFVATQGQSSVSAVGELYVDYRIKLMTPQLSNPALGSAKSGKYTATEAAPTLVAAQGSNAPLVPSGSLTGTVTLTATSAYQCVMAIYGTITTGNPSIPTVGGTATRTEPLGLVGTGSNYAYIVEVSFLAGQTLTVDPSDPATYFQIEAGQYNTSL